MLMKVDKLDIGMVLDKDVIDIKIGTILISKDTIMTRVLIDKLIRNDINEVFIKEEIIPEGMRNESITKSYSKVEKSLDSIFDGIKDGEKIDTEKVVNDMTDFIDEISLERDILTQMRLLKKKDDYTFNHSLGVSILAISLGKWLNYSKEKIMDLSIAALFHDIGKLRVPDEIVTKPGKLTIEEYELMKKHSYYGYEILLKTGKFNNDILLGVLQHHEKMDGKGYPNSLTGDRIHEYAKIISICDIYHALISQRVYKDKENPLKVADYISEESFSSLDPHLVQLFLNNISRFYVGNKVLLSDGKTGTIVYINPQNKTKVIVKSDERFINYFYPQDVEIVEIIV